MQDTLPFDARDALDPADFGDSGTAEPTLPSYEAPVDDQSMTEKEITEEGPKGDQGPAVGHAEEPCEPKAMEVEGAPAVGEGHKEMEEDLTPEPPIPTGAIPMDAKSDEKPDLTKPNLLAEPAHWSTFNYFIYVCYIIGGIRLQ